MPTEDERPENMPDTSETYERGHPEKEPGGGLEANDIKPDHSADESQSSLRNSDDDDSEGLSGQDPQNQGDAVNPSDPAAHAGRADAAVNPKADDSDLTAETTPERGEA